MSLTELGFTASFEDAFSPHHSQGRIPARVARMDRDLYHVLIAPDAEPLRAETSGRLRHEAREAADFPAVGDWVAIAPPEGGTTLIHAVLPRATAFTRTAPGRETIEQVVAANVDVAFLVAGLDNDFNLRRLERYLVAARESGARPVIVLNKADLLAPSLFAVRLAETEEVAAGAPVHALIELPEHWKCETSSRDPRLNTRSIRAGWLARWFVNNNCNHVGHHHDLSVAMERLPDYEAFLMDQASFKYFEESYPRFYLRFCKYLLTGKY